MKTELKDLGNLAGDRHAGWTSEPAYSVPTGKVPLSVSSSLTRYTF